MTVKSGSPGDPYQRFETEKLILDPENPRIVEMGLGHNPKQFDILKALWEKMAVAEVAMSIAWNGYFLHEPLFIEVDKQGKWVVIEGNRRLAAVKLLLDETLRQKVGATDLPDIDKINPGRRAELAKLPGQITTRKDLWRYLGFKHVNGPATWGAYAKAQYVSKVHNEYKIPLEAIAQQIGDYNNTVERQYHGLMVVEQAERAGVFDRNNVKRKKGFEFSHIYEGLSREGIQRFLGLTRESRSKKDPVPDKKVKNLGELLEWLYGNNAKNIEPRMRTQAKDLEILSSVLMSNEGVAALRNGLSLDLARDAALGDEQLFKQAVTQCKVSLQDAVGLVTTGFDPLDEHSLSQAQSVEQLATNLVDAMQAKRRKKRRQSQGAGTDE
jgi:hypothetical protein